jgi:hypothetical protein
MRELSNAMRTMILAEELGFGGLHRLEGCPIELSKRLSTKRMYCAQMAPAFAKKVSESLATCLFNEGEGHGG